MQLSIKKTGEICRYFLKQLNQKSHEKNHAINFTQVQKILFFRGCAYQ
jgi:hypothetical protein